MLIGIDLDNTIVSYDLIFHKIAQEHEFVPSFIRAEKVAVRDYMRLSGREKQWTEMQGIVYGARMEEALPYQGVVSFFQRAKWAGHQIVIVSHRSKHPILGPKYNLHTAARDWISAHIRHNEDELISYDNIFLELTKEAKLATISRLGCDLFIDDLPELLMSDSFPLKAKRVLFDPATLHSNLGETDIFHVSTWDELLVMLKI
jgi:hypothetical protein